MKFQTKLILKWNQLQLCGPQFLANYNIICVLRKRESTNKPMSKWGFVFMKTLARIFASVFFVFIVLK